MKRLFFAVALLMTFTLFSCKKELGNADNNQLAHVDTAHIKEWYKIYAIGGTDTTSTPAMLARTETVGLLSAEDSRLRVAIIAYNGHGKFTLQATNLQNCQEILRWNIDGNDDLRIDSIVAMDSTYGTPESDVLKPNQTKIFSIYTNAMPGKIKVQAQGYSCGNSSTLILNITTSILPITLVDYNAEFNSKSGKTILNFTLLEPEQTDWISIRKLINNEWKEIMLIGCNKVTKSYSIPL